MVYKGKNINDRTVKKVLGSLSPSLKEGERVIGLFNASRIITPPIGGLVFTNRRILFAKSPLGYKIEINNELAADEIAEFTQTKKILKSRQVVIIKNNGSTMPAGFMYVGDAEVLNGLLVQMQGKPAPIVENIHEAGQAEKVNKRAEKAELKASKKQQKELKKQAKKDKKASKIGLFTPKEEKLRILMQPVRESLQQDRQLLVTAIVSAIRKHWNVLEDKLESHTDEDDYGNFKLNDGFRFDMIYFCDKVVLPELESIIQKGQTANKGLVLILQDTLKALSHSLEDYGINFEDADGTIAANFLATIDGSTLEDETLSELNQHNFKYEYYLENATHLFMVDSSITLQFQDKLRVSEPLRLTPFEALVCTLFFAMHNTKKTEKIPEAKHDFIGNDPYLYEEFIKVMLRKEGFNATRTRGSGDFGVDVLARKNGKSYAIQCKLYNRTVGTKSVQEIISGKAFYKTDYAIVVSDNTFTDAAKVLARQTGVVLAHHKDLLRKIQRLEALHTQNRID